MSIPGPAPFPHVKKETPLGAKGYCEVMATALTGSTGRAMDHEDTPVDALQQWYGGLVHSLMSIRESPARNWDPDAPPR